jgi:hypothetical protein
MATADCDAKLIGIVPDIVATRAAPGVAMYWLSVQTSSARVSVAPEEQLLFAGFCTSAAVYFLNVFSAVMQ